MPSEKLLHMQQLENAKDGINSVPLKTEQNVPRVDLAVWSPSVASSCE
jgi:hypothetical protein